MSGKERHSPLLRSRMCTLVGHTAGRSADVDKTPSVLQSYRWSVEVSWRVGRAQRRPVPSRLFEERDDGARGLLRHRGRSCRHAEI